MRKAVEMFVRIITVSVALAWLCVFLQWILAGGIH
jgi:hypothetical protein